MAFIPTPEGIKVAVNYLLFGVPCANILTFNNNAPINILDVENYAVGVLSLWENSVMPLLSVDLSLIDCTATGMNSQSAYQFVAEPSGSVVGGVSGASSPGNVALCVTLRTGLIGRSQKGRIFLPGIPESSTTGNQFNGTPLNALTAVFQGFVDNGELDIPALTSWSVTSFYTNGVAQGTQQDLSATYNTFTEDFNVSAKDYIEVRAKSAGEGDPTTIRYFGIYTASLEQTCAGY